MKKHSISIRGHRTSYSLEEEFDLELRKIADEAQIPLAKLITQIDSKRSQDKNLSSALRLYVLENLKQKLSPHKQ